MFQFTNATQSANFRLLKEDYGPAEEWVLFQAKPKPGSRDAPKKPGARGAPKKSFKTKLAKKNKKCSYMIFYVHYLRNLTPVKK